MSAEFHIFWRDILMCGIWKQIQVVKLVCCSALLTRQLSLFKDTNTSHMITDSFAAVSFTVMQQSALFIVHTYPAVLPPCSITTLVCLSQYKLSLSEQRKQQRFVGINHAKSCQRCKAATVHTTLFFLLFLTLLPPSSPSSKLPLKHQNRVNFRSHRTSPSFRWISAAANSRI